MSVVEIPGLAGQLAAAQGALGPGLATNTITVRDLTSLTKKDLDQALILPEELVDGLLRGFVEAAPQVGLGIERPTIASWTGQSMYDFKRDPTRTEKMAGGVIGGLPLTDERRRNSKTYGVRNSPYVGFMDNITPVRVKQDSSGRLSQQPDRVWFRLDLAFSDFNKTKIFGGPSDNRGYCAYNLTSARACFTWFAITKAFLGKNTPSYANQLNAWAPDFTRAPAREAEFYRLCFAFGLAENRCVVTRFEADNPVPGAPEVFVDNPLCPGNPSAFWATVLAPEFAGIAPVTDAAARLVEAVTNVYKHWATKVCTSQMMTDVGLKDEAYFKYFDAPDFLTPRAGLVQIRAYAQRNTGEHWYPELQSRLTRLADLREAVKGEIHRLLVGELGYFG